MSAPHLPRSRPAARRVGPARVRPVGPRLMLRGLLVALALLLLVVLLVGCGNAGLPAGPRTPAPAPTAAPTVPPSPQASPTASPDPTTTTPPSGTGTGDRTPERADGGGRDGGGKAAPAPGAQPARPIWPATDAAAARNLQQQVDSGSEPWLLDPEEVAISYAGVELGYRDPTVVVLAPGRVDLQDGRTRAQALVTLQQTVRSGPGGIWLVIRVDRR